MKHVKMEMHVVIHKNLCRTSQNTWEIFIVLMLGIRMMKKVSSQIHELKQMTERE